MGMAVGYVLIRVRGFVLRGGDGAAPIDEPQHQPVRVRGMFSIIQRNTIAAGRRTFR
jgi:hypothetical protein